MTILIRSWGYEPGGGRRGSCWASSPSPPPGRSTLETKKRHGPPPYVAQCWGRLGRPLLDEVVLRSMVRAHLGPSHFRGSAAKITRTKMHTDHISQDNVAPQGPTKSAPTRCSSWWWSVSFWSLDKLLTRNSIRTAPSSRCIERTKMWRTSEWLYRCILL